MHSAHSVPQIVVVHEEAVEAKRIVKVVLVRVKQAKKLVPSVRICWSLTGPEAISLPLKNTVIACIKSVEADVVRIEERPKLFVSTVLQFARRNPLYYIVSGSVFAGNL